MPEILVFALTKTRLSIRMIGHRSEVLISVLGSDREPWDTSETCWVFKSVFGFGIVTV